MVTRRLGLIMYLLAFIFLLGLLTWSFSEYAEHKENRTYEITPLAGAAGGVGVRLKKSRSGHYLAMGKINGQSINFMIDTGATDVVISAQLAKKAGIQQKEKINLMTANGWTEGWSANIATIELGEIVEHDIRAVIAPSLGTMRPLLGMSFLERLSFSQKGNELIIQKTVPSK